jgi:hypothetical protein
VTVDTPRSIYSREEVMNVRKVAVEWSDEVGYRWRDLESLIVNAAINGEFDDPSGKHGFYVKDPETRRVYPTTGKSVADGLAGPQSDFMLHFGKEEQLFVVHRDAVLAFARKRDLPLPSWWNLALTSGANLRPARRGPRPAKFEDVKAAMRTAISKGAALSDMKQKEMQHKFSASRETCVKARAAVLEGSSAQLATNSDK